MDELNTRKIYPPWTTEQVDALNAYQKSGAFHPFTCANRPHPGNEEAVLTAIPDGWRCRSCAYTQEWAHAFMADAAWLARYRAVVESLTTYTSRREAYEDLDLADHHRPGDLAP